MPFDLDDEELRATRKRNGVEDELKKPITVLVYDEFISKEKIKEKINEIENYTFMSEEEIKQQDYAIKKLNELLEVN